MPGRRPDVDRRLTGGDAGGARVSEAVTSTGRACAGGVWKEDGCG